VENVFPISLLAPGELAEVISIVGLPDRARRLEEIGLRRGVRVEMIQNGSPAIVRVNGCKLCIRATDEAQVMVRMGHVA
jgi:Fe2+ transport system protein FeoA